jgi:hypothetical protein
MTKLKNFLSKPWLSPLLLFVIGIVVYGIFFKLGFYWDDWPVLYLMKSRSTQTIIDYYFYDRPFSSWTYLALFPVLGFNATLWHLVTFVFRWAGTVLLYEVFLSIWPNRQWQLRWVAALILFFPGFTQQSISVAYDQHFLTFFLFSLSLFLMVLSIKKPGLFSVLTVVAMLLSFLQMFTLEYFAGLELIRPVILWLIFRNIEPTKSQTFKKTLKYWAPYVVPLLIFAWWRLIYYPSFPIANENTLTGLQQVLASPIDGLTHLAKICAQDIFYLIVTVWTKLFTFKDYNFPAASSLFAIALGIVTAVVYFLLNTIASRKDRTEDPNSLPLSALWVSLLLIVLGGIAFWINGSQITRGKWSDRLTLAPLIGASILFVFLMEKFGQLVTNLIVRATSKTTIKAYHIASIFLVTILALSLSSQFLTTNTYRLDWINQQNMYWQFYWRAPYVQSDTNILSYFTADEKQADYSIADAFNMLYHDPTSGTTPDYWYLTQVDTQRSQLKDPDSPYSMQLRNLTFQSVYGNSLPIYPSHSQCLRIIDQPYYDDPSVVEEKYYFHIANVSRISAQAPNPDFVPDPAIFGSEPARTWCYYFEKADLARQYSDWQTIIKLQTEANQKGYTPANDAEYLPFIEANVQTGNWQTAIELSQETIQSNDKLKDLVCDNWRRFSDLGISPAKGYGYQQVMTSLGCQ